jgi:hypothetical protein
MAVENCGSKIVFSSAMSLRFIAATFCGHTISRNALKKLADQWAA